jgi:hypothetical protein
VCTRQIFGIKIGRWNGQNKTKPVKDADSLFQPLQCCNRTYYFVNYRLIYKNKRQEA